MLHCVPFIYISMTVSILNYYDQLQKKKNDSGNKYMSMWVFIIYESQILYRYFVNEKKVLYAHTTESCAIYKHSTHNTLKSAFLQNIVAIK